MQSSRHTQALRMDFTTVTSAHIQADYLTFEELRGRAKGRAGVRGGGGGGGGEGGPGKFSCTSSWRTPNHK